MSSLIHRLLILSSCMWSTIRRILHDLPYLYSCSQSGIKAEDAFRNWPASNYTCNPSVHLITCNPRMYLIPCNPGVHLITCNPGYISAVFGNSIYLSWMSVQHVNFDQSVKVLCALRFPLSYRLTFNRCYYSYQRS